MNRVPLLAACLTLATPSEGVCQPAAPVEITVLDRATGKPVPCRIHLKDAAGKPQRPTGLPFWFDHFVCPRHGRARPAARASTPSRSSAGRSIAASPARSRSRPGTTKKLAVELERLADLRRRGLVVRATCTCIGRSRTSSC